MCDPLSMTAVSVGSTGLEIYAQNQVAEAEGKAAYQAALADFSTLLEQQRQIEEKYNLEETERAKQAMRERSRLMVAMGEAGISGNSPLREIANSYLQKSYDIGIIENNKENQLYDNRKKVEAVSTNAKSRINKANASAISPGLAALKIGSSAALGYMSGSDLSKIRKGGT